MHHGRPVGDFQFHPNEPEWVLASAWTTCEDFKGTGKECAQYKEMYYSSDLGLTWKSLQTYVYQYQWSRTQKQHQEIKNRIIVAYEPKGYGNQTNTGWKESLRVSYSDNFCKNMHPLVLHGNRFLMTKSFLFVARAENKNSNLMVSPDPHQMKRQGNFNKDEYNFQPIKIEGIDMNQLDSHAYTILQTTKQQVFLHINHQGPYSKYGSIYTSDQSGINFADSLQNQVRSSDGQTDFEKLGGLNGIILVNYYEQKIIDEFQETARQYSIFETDFDFQGGKKNQKKTVIDLNKHKKSLISFDNGGIWQSIQVPENMRQKCQKEKECSLHLNNYSTGNNFGPLYSTKNSIGLLIGTGNIGEYLSQNPDQIDTYLSIDGGRNWDKVADGSHIYEVGDHGGIIVMCNDQEATDTLLYSWDEGKNWQKYIFSDEKIEVTNIITEPSNVATNFLIVGQKSVGSDIQGVLIGIDFDQIMDTACQGVNSANSQESDYELWKPSSCLLGKTSSYLKKKRDRKCFNGQAFERKVVEEICECTQEDWECDTGFVLNPQTKVCEKEFGENKEIDYNFVPDQCFYSYQISRGYRKVPGDVCRGGVDLSPLVRKCPQFLIRNLIIIGIFIGIGFYFGYQRQDLLMDKIEKLRTYVNLPNQKENKPKNFMEQFLKHNNSKKKKQPQRNKFYNPFDEENNNNSNQSKNKYFENPDEESETLVNDNDGNNNNDDSYMEGQQQQQNIVQFDSSNFQQRFGGDNF